jgi:hypothetical protein
MAWHRPFGHGVRWKLMESGGLDLIKLKAKIWFD